MEHFQNGAFSKDSIFIGVFGRFSVGDMRKRIKKYAFPNKNALVWMGPFFVIAAYHLQRNKNPACQKNTKVQKLSQTYSLSYHILLIMSRKM